ncbi:D-alanyl-D-alanine carboxypeptidase/D-alanyl-D-alanine endopeptidase [Catellatospora tritici]|uniref:D-alanyl-D-alanine carboxypeptidase/D-alanyl-D-alanine endopeptidase n=1 Tax=Catellatospora tritici TaxID=2851566 RepID=UPI001C2DDDF0|nr:D-alanyl-D-alanine carboxypeptidase/D-alanyl-D-alanine-endopeptidase [Catellatospora tritici]MBV1853424.1 D-alanyl-D-alanine carboxypeptidase/D-alanyl-D-alanine-endopeptidase [Catellatospora tritici]
MHNPWPGNTQPEPYPQGYDQRGSYGYEQAAQDTQRLPGAPGGPGGAPAPTERSAAPHNRRLKKKKKKSRRGLLATSLVLVSALGLGLVGVGLAKPSLVADLLSTPGWQSPSPTASAEPAPAAVLAAAAADAPMPTTAGLTAVLGPLVTGTALGSHISASVVDLHTGQVLYELDPTEMITPASNTKLVTAASVLATRGPTYRITTRVVAGPNPGEVVLIGAGDATLGVNSKKFYEGAAQLDTLAAQVKKAMGTTPITKVITDGSLFPGSETGPGWSSDAPQEGNVSKITALMINGARTDIKDREMPFNRYTNPERAAGEAFAKLLGLPAGAVAKGVAPAAPAADPAAQPSTAASAAPVAILPGVQLGAVQSAPLLRQIEQMLTESDNTLAEMLAHQVALAKGKPGSFVGASAAMEEVVTELGLDPAQIDLSDGSGMSGRNKISPKQLTALLVKAASGDHAQLADFFNGLPVAGWSGTMLPRFAKVKTAYGLVRAKSGTLDGVNSLSGVLQTADGRMLAFAVLADNVPGGRYPAQDALDKIAAALASCGCH